MSTVEENRPPAAVLRIVNPVMRALVPSPAGRVVPGSVCVLHFTGRRSGRPLGIVVGMHEVEGGPAVITSRPWRLNFRGGREVEVAQSGRRRRGTGTLVEDADVVAEALNGVLRAGTKPRMLGLRMPAGHTLTADDVRATERTLIRLAF